MSNKEKNNKALFIQRFVAFLIDILLVYFVATLIATPFVNTDSISKLSESATDVLQKYSNGEISSSTYLVEAGNISYHLNRANGITSFVSVFLSILYFVVYQFYANGQTLGKKLMKIRVVNNDGEKLTLNSIIFRALIINSIFADMLLLAIITFSTENTYLYGASLVGVLDYFLIIVCGFMVMFSKSGRGLHDFIGHTKVVRI